MTDPIVPEGQGPGRRRWLRRARWENASALLIGLGLFMLMQPFLIELYTYSFVVILAGTASFLVTAHFPE
jgi:hypothetical protein